MMQASTTSDTGAGPPLDWLIELNFEGVAGMTRSFPPELRASDDARIVNLSSRLQQCAAPAGALQHEVERARALAQRLLRMAPEQAGELIVRGIKRLNPVHYGTLSKRAPGR